MPEEHEVLAAPVGPVLTNATYGKEYFLLLGLASGCDRIHIDAYVHRVDAPVPASNVDVHEVNCKTTTRYYLKCFQVAWRKLSEGSIELYHHMNLSYRSFNPAILTGAGDDIPIVIGPAQPPHGVPEESFRSFAKKTTGLPWPKPLLQAMYPAIKSVMGGINRVREYLFGATLRRADCVIVVNEATAKIYSQYMPRTNIEVIPYGVDLDRFIVGTDRSSKDLVAIGSLIDRKGFDYLFDAWSTVVSKYPDAHLQVFGDGPRREQLEDQVDRLGIDDSVRFHGRVDHSTIREHLATARAFVHPSLSEGFPHVRLEAMASGCPVIVTDVIGTDEMIRDGTDGLVVPTGEAAPLAEAMCDLLSNPEKARTFGMNARERAEERFDWTDITKQHLDIYRSLL